MGKYLIQRIFKLSFSFFSLLFIFLFFLFLIPNYFKIEVNAVEPNKIDYPIRECRIKDGSGGCPKELIPLYNRLGEQCVHSMSDFMDDPYNNHFWVNDPQITAQGKADERARQFLYWTLTRNSIDNHPILLTIWNTTRNVTYFLLLIVVAVMGIGIIVGQKANFSTKIPIWSSIMKIVMLLLYITFSASLVIFVINLSDILMKFFIENLGGNDLFNIYFSNVNKEANYIDWYGCKDLNYLVQEAVDSEIFLLKLTNITYYVMGTMIVLRKVLLWFLLFVSPFLAILAPFIFIRNIGWIWIGVFFQWVFYGPLFALFLGATSIIWKAGIPFNFDFSRVSSTAGYVYPTGMNILYGGPGQSLGGMNNGNYVDTFAEYIITLIMLWAIVFFPWWLLRIFRDYCCEGIYAMKNILLSMYDQMRGGPSPQPPSGPTPTPTHISTDLKIPTEIEIPIRVKLETIEEIKKARTEDITRSLNVSVSKLTDIAHFETDKRMQENVRKNIDYLQNPIKAETATERQKYMNIRSELFSRAVKEDKIARQVLSSISTSKTEQLQNRDELLKSIPQTVAVTRIVSIKVKTPHDKVKSVTSSFISTASSKSSVIKDISTKSQVSEPQVQNVLTSLSKNISEAPQNIIPKIVQETGIEKKPVIIVIQIFKDTVKENKDLVKEVALQENMKPEEVENIVITQLPIIAEPEKHVEEMISIPPTIPIEDYEQVKHLWKTQYDKGEVPVSDVIKSRKDWVDKDIVFITNTLNKLLSSSEELRQEGLDEIGYILPIFLINNLKGEELVVYLKAKLEAAKETKEELEKQKELTEKLQVGKEEVYIEVEKPKAKKEEKVMEMKNELKQEFPDQTKNPNQDQNPKPQK